MSEDSQPDSFKRRHIGSFGKDAEEMLKTVGAKSTWELVRQAVPADILSDENLSLPSSKDEHAFLEHMAEIASLNRRFKSFIGLGYNDCKVPEVIKRNILENPGWYTQYTPYQAEISQGRLEALLNFQTVICDMTGMEVANASLLDEATAACEAMAMIHRVVSGKSRAETPGRFFVDRDCFPQTLEVLRSRTEPLGIEIVVDSFENFEPEGEFFGALVQFPDRHGEARDYKDFIERAHKAGVFVVVAADILSLAVFSPPGEIGADVVVGSTQRLGVPMGCGGPHAAYFATRKKFQRQVPGRIIGVSVDREGSRAYRMSLQTREQHIRREKATSNICTAQSLPAIMAAMYCVYHGPGGLEKIAKKIHSMASLLSRQLAGMGFVQKNPRFFDTLSVDLSSSGGVGESIREISLGKGMNFLHSENRVGVSLDETTEISDLNLILRVFSEARGKSAPEITAASFSDEDDTRSGLERKTGFLIHPVFNSHHSETEMVRYIKRLENKDLSLTHSMIPLGSCTMKLNAASELVPVSWAGFSAIHPFAPRDQLRGYERLIGKLGDYLCEITGFSAASIQPNSGAQGEFAGLMVIRAYYKSSGQGHRDVVLVPSSAHGTNPASAAAAGMRVVTVGCAGDGAIDLKDLREKCAAHSQNLAAIMITYPSTHGVFEPGIRKVCEAVHRHGGQVYMDGANLNAQVGIIKPGLIGADLCHVNLHKTFSIPHGGGGPGMGPICVARHLAPFLPGHPFGNETPDTATAPVASAPWGSASIAIISYAYIRLLGTDGVRQATMHAILNANYMKQRLGRLYKVLYEGNSARVAHEFILDLREFKKSAGVEIEDFAKRLMDYGFHAPTVSWPVAGTIMIEPTESESKAELDRFCDALESIRAEIADIEAGRADRSDNVLKNSPHTARNVISGVWEHPYSRQSACFPADFVMENKFWPPVSRIDNAYGDRNLFCTCPPPEDYEED